MNIEIHINYRFQCGYACMNAFQDVEENEILEKFSSNAPIKKKNDFIFSAYNGTLTESRRISPVPP